MSKAVKKFTPAKMFEILTEIKNLCKNNEFFPKNYITKEPSVYHILRVLIKKGIVVRGYNEYIWVGIDPHINMARAVIKEYRNNSNIAREEYEQRRKAENVKSIPEMIEFPPREVLPEIHYEPIKEGVVEYKIEDLRTIGDLRKQLAEYELEVSGLLKQNAELKYQIDKMQELRQEKKSKHRKVKFLGITIFKIEQ